jgi:hypothetical protein
MAASAGGKWYPLGRRGPSMPPGRRFAPEFWGHEQRGERAAADGERRDVVRDRSSVARSQIRSRIASIW